MTSVGVNGARVYTTTGEEVLDLYVMLNRGMASAEIENAVTSIVRKDDIRQIEDLLVLLFQTRDIRGGKGEKQLFFHLFWAIFRANPEWINKVFHLIPTYGCYLDFIKILDQCLPQDTLPYRYLRRCIRDHICKQFRDDQKSLSPSLLAKWMPREGKQYNRIALQLADQLFRSGDIQGKLRRYRKAIGELTKRIDVAETHMCHGTWKDLKFERMPGRCLKAHPLAFQNLRKDKKTVRCMNNEDRIECAKHYTQFCENIANGKVKAHGANVIFPHEIVHKFLDDRYSSELTSQEKTVLESQFEDITSKFKGGLLGKTVVMCDVSGSMMGTPMEVSIALGMVCASLSEGPFKDHIMTFDSNPKLHCISPLWSLEEKIKKIGELPVGMSTNLEKAVDLLMTTLKKNRMDPEDAPKYLLVITDMGFDQLSTYENYHRGLPPPRPETHVENIKKRFGESKYKPPTIVIWNVRAEFKQFSATAYENGVVNLSGWSPSILSLFEHPTLTTPYDSLRKILDHARYDPVRDAFRGKVVPH